MDGGCGRGAPSFLSGDEGGECKCPYESVNINIISRHKIRQTEIEGKTIRIFQLEQLVPATSEIPISRIACMLYSRFFFF